jgi:hypothetical protein
MKLALCLMLQRCRGAHRASVAKYLHRGDGAPDLVARIATDEAPSRHRNFSRSVFHPGPSPFRADARRRCGRKEPTRDALRTRRVSPVKARPANRRPSPAEKNGSPAAIRSGTQVEPSRLEQELRQPGDVEIEIEPIWIEPYGVSTAARNRNKVRLASLDVEEW